MADSSPERDRRLARAPRYSYRRAAEVSDVVGGFMSSDAVKRMRRFQRVVPALQRVVPKALLDKLTPATLQGPTLTLEVADGVALAELRAHHAHAILTALAEGGTAITRLAWRLKRSGA